MASEHGGHAVETEERGAHHVDIIDPEEKHLALFLIEPAGLPPAALARGVGHGADLRPGLSNPRKRTSFDSTCG